MHRLAPQLRGLLVALATLALSAGIVLAARPTTVEAPPAAADDGLTRASEASGTTVPVRPEPPALPEVDEEPDEEAPEVEEDADGEPLVGEGERPQNHGWFVSEAAKGATPEGFENHGTYVSEIAQGDEGMPEAAAAAGERGAAATEAAAAAGERGAAAAEAAQARKSDTAPQAGRAASPAKAGRR